MKQSRELFGSPRREAAVALWGLWAECPSRDGGPGLAGCAPARRRRGRGSAGRGQSLRHGWRRWRERIRRDCFTSET